jgi:hypothetical protein
MRLVLIGLVTLLAPMLVEHAVAQQPSPQPGATAPPRRAPVVIRKTDVTYGRVQEAWNFIDQLERATR